MKTCLQSLALSFLLCFTTLGEDFSGTSPSGKIGFASKNQKEFYIWSTENPKKQTLLYREDAVFIHSALISPDDSWIALEWGGASAGHTILFFKRGKSLSFIQSGGSDHDYDPVEKEGAFALRSKALQPDVLDHSYLHPVKWSNNSKWLTVMLDAKGIALGKNVLIRDWLCRYSPSTKSVESSKENAGRIEITKRQN